MADMKKENMELRETKTVKPNLRPSQGMWRHKETEGQWQTQSKRGRSQFRK